jgi:hypothetical protein
VDASIASLEKNVKHIAFKTVASQRQPHTAAAIQFAVP